MRFVNEFYILEVFLIKYVVFRENNNINKNYIKDIFDLTSLFCDRFSRCKISTISKYLGF